MTRLSKVWWCRIGAGILLVAGVSFPLFLRIHSCSRSNGTSLRDLNESLSSVEIVYAWGSRVRTYTFATLDPIHHDTVRRESSRFLELASGACWDLIKSGDEIPKSWKSTGKQVEFHAVTGRNPGRVRFSTFADEQRSYCVMQSGESFSISNSSEGGPLTMALASLCSELMEIPEENVPVK